jgi:hypothetical protein
MSIILSLTGFAQSITKFEIKLFGEKQCSKTYPQHSEQHFAMLELLSPKCCTIDFPLFLDVDNEGDYESEYMDWYVRNTRKFIGRPISPSSEFQIRICFMSFSFIYLRYHSTNACRMLV